MKIKIIKRVCNIIKPHKKMFFMITIFAIIVSLLSALRPMIIKYAIDNFMQNKISEIQLSKLNRDFIITIYHVGIFYIFVAITENILGFLTMKYETIIGEKILHETRQKIFNFSQRTNVKFHDKTPSGTLYDRITSDTEDLAIFFQDILVTLFKDIIYVIIISAIILTYNWKLSLIVYGTTMICILITYSITKKANKAYTLAKNVRTNLNIFLSETIYGAKTIKIFNIQRRMNKKSQEINKEYCEKYLNAVKIDAALPQILFFFMYLTLAIIIGVSIKKWWNIDIPIGVLYIFVAYVKELFDPIYRTLENIEGAQEAVTSLNKIYDLIEQDEYLEDFDKGKQLTDVRGKLEFKHVWFKYNENDENWILKDINFCIEPTQTIALVGKTGAGKTTITNLVNRFYEVQKGEILIDGVNIKDINLKSLRNHIGNVLQDPFIFSGTIKENIELYNNLSDKQVNKAIDLASARDFIDSLPNGIYEKAVERGENFSVGQKQLVAFARIFALNPDIFILDEATANIDTSTEKLIQKSIDTLSKEKTAIFIAHRLSTIVNVDKILVLKDGEIIEEGNHKELLEKNGYYANLYNSYYQSLR